MTKRKRDYAAEYKRRVDRALKLGYSLAIARGHPKTKTVWYVKKSTGEKKKKKVVVELGLRAAKLLGERPGEDIAKLIARDAKYVFGKKPKRGFGDDSAPAYQLRLEELARRDGTFDWINERAFIDQMMALGLTENDAYVHWMSP
jgi:hypothetical protein